MSYFTQKLLNNKTFSGQWKLQNLKSWVFLGHKMKSDKIELCKMVQELTLISFCSLLFIKRFPAQCCSVNIMDCSFFGTLEVNRRIKLALCYWAKHSRQKEDWCHTNASTLFLLRLKCCNSMGQEYYFFILMGLFSFRLPAHHFVMFHWLFAYTH